MSKFIEKNVVVGPFSCNCRILVCTETREAVLIDTGDEAGKILQAISKIEQEVGGKLNVTHLLHTHAHLDHIGGSRGVMEGLVRVLGEGTSSPKIALHKNDLELYQALKEQGKRFGIVYDSPLPVDHLMEHEEEIKFGKQKLTVVHTPGHSPGSLCLKLHQDTASGAKESLYTGDTLFQGNVGRTDLWGASEEQMFQMIRERIITHDDDTRVCPGHGMNSTIGVEKRTNPYLAGL
ncbi:MAG: MBL fold metallo-hydrolase [Xanthomonadaceae bacterium]|nr:MBL fold metallo-hydrolase [Xanthomonadaceae bacterium]